MFIYLKKSKIIFTNFFLVGGAIRDKLINGFFLEKDWIIIKANIKYIYNFKLVGKSFPVFLNPINKEECSFAREYGLSYDKNNKHLFKFSYFTQINDDLLNRDLIINTLILSKHGFIIDKFKALAEFKKRMITCTSFYFTCDSLRIFRVIRFFIKYYTKLFNLTAELLILIQYLSFTDNHLNTRNERILKEFFASLKYKYTFLFFFLAYKFSILKYIFRELHLLCLLSDLVKFNPYINFSNHLFKLIYFLTYKTNNKYLLFSILFFKSTYYVYLFYDKNIIFKYKRVNINNLLYYKKKFHLSKKQLNFITHLSSFYLFYHKFNVRSSIILYNTSNIINFCKNKINLINMLMICALDEEQNNIVNNFYKKYIFLDILNTINIDKGNSGKKYKHHFMYNNIKKIIINNKNKYKNLYFFL